MSLRALTPIAHYLHNPIPEKNGKEGYAMSCDAKITAHSGCEGTPRDSLESVELGIALGADYVEVDVRRAPNGELVISHDRRDDYREHLRLEAVLSLLAADGRVGVNCDLKEPEAALEALELCRRWGIQRERLVLSGGLTPSMLRQAPELARQAGIYLNIEELLGEALGASASGCAWDAVNAAVADVREYLEMIEAICGEVGADALNLPYIPFTEPCFELPAGRVALSAWTIDEPSLMEKLFRLGIGNLTTRNVSQAIRVKNTINGGAI